LIATRDSPTLTTSSIVLATGAPKPAVLDGLREAGVTDVPVVVGGIIPEADAAVLLDLGVAAVFTPKDFAITDIMGEFVRLIRAAHGLDAPALLASNPG
jgi:methylmalonyl-CoA mutase cobalamin-binding domain/chain